MSRSTVKGNNDAGEKAIAWGRRALACLLVAFTGQLLPAAEPQPGWVQTGTLAAPEAKQAVAADDEFVYVIDNKVVAKYSRKTQQRVATSTGPATHLNSGFLFEGKLYCAHSNYPKVPEQSEIKVLDPQSMKLSTFRKFEGSPHGSLTVAIFDRGSWWCVFARYGAENVGTVLVRFDRDWAETGVWTFPASVVSDLGKSSISGGIWQGNRFLATGHDKQLIYELELPENGTVLTHLSTRSAPFFGQGIAADPATGGLVGIDRKSRLVLFAVPESGNQAGPAPAGEPSARP
ncbi:endonuclease [Planctomicrobium sp. SH664]|uniref:endonuclease n=1 Tax=Planctomicrobium sp. SH664 TaxID=3448125 RepID=UPI003F5C31F3